MKAPSLAALEIGADNVIVEGLSMGVITNGAKAAQF